MTRPYVVRDAIARRDLTIREAVDARIRTERRRQAVRAFLRELVIVVALIGLFLAMTARADAADPSPSPERRCNVCTITPTRTPRPGPVVVGIPPASPAPQLTLPPTDTLEIAR